MNAALFTPASELSGLPIGEHPRHDAWSPLRRHVWVCQVLPIGEHPRHNAWSPLRRHVNVFRVLPIGEHPRHDAWNPLRRHINVCQVLLIDIMLRVHLGIMLTYVGFANWRTSKT